MARYEAGETLASIARTYDCSPPAISYVVSRSRARPAGQTPPPAAAEPHLVKAEAPAAQPPAPAAEAADGSAGVADLSGGARQAPLPLVRHPHPAPPATAANGDQRRTLHLSLGNGTQPEVARGDASHRPGIGATAAAPGPERQSAGRDWNREGVGRPTPPAPVSSAPAPSALAGRAGEDGGYGNGYHGRPEGMPRKEAAGSIDRELRARVDADISAFLAAFDAALALDSEENRAALRETTDRLLRAGARTRIELERLEARVPLPRRNNGTPQEPAWRYR